MDTKEYILQMHKEQNKLGFSFRKTLNIKVVFQNLYPRLISIFLMKTLKHLRINLFLERK